ncbi:hypothetical protein BBP40_007357 [Aspergillus hancockii]|nr:hypothetical protein BBP40_007357 [Aspergillus hancockii]
MDVGEPSSSNTAITITIEKDGFYEVTGTKQEPMVSLYMIHRASKSRRMLRDTIELIVCPAAYYGSVCSDRRVTRLQINVHEMIANLDPFGPPLITDIDTRYGSIIMSPEKGDIGPSTVSKSVQQYIQAGVTGFHVEDQIQNKRCAHLAGKRVVDLNEYKTRICAAKLTKHRLRSDIILNARTDALQ